MQDPAETTRQLEPQPSRAVSPHGDDTPEQGLQSIPVSIENQISEAVSQHHDKTPELEPQSTVVPTEKQPTTAQAVLKILSTVENIWSKFDESDDSSSDDSSEGESPHYLHRQTENTVDRNHPYIERLPISMWNPDALLGSKPYRKGLIIATAFYTEVPGSAVAAEASLSDDELRAAYSKDKWSSGPRRILIHNRGLIKALRNITHVPDSQRTGTLTMVPPFKHLIHHRQAINSKLDELRQEASSLKQAAGSAEDTIQDSQTLVYLQGIYDFIHTDLANYIGLELKIRDGDIEEVIFEEVYHLFKPGDLVLASETGENQLYQVSSVTGGRMLLSTRNDPPGIPPHMRGSELRAGSWMDLQVICFSMGWDGENIGPRQAHFSISYFSGRRLVRDLELYPIQFHETGDELHKRMCARGSKLIDCYGHKKYTGTSVPPLKAVQMFRDRRMATAPGFIPTGNGNPPEDEEVRPNPFELVRGDVYIDYKAFYVNYFSTLPFLSLVPTGPGEDAEAIDTLSNGNLWNCSDRDMDSLQSERFRNTHRHLTKFGRPRETAQDQDRLRLLPGQVPAFLFSSRRWEWLDLDNIEDIDKSEPSRNSGWNELVIPSSFSELLLSLVSNHISDVRIRKWETSTEKSPSLQIDLVRGKGRGLIILLHGPPGSGKTSTAETIAAYTGRPLYALTCGDLGTAPKELEKNLVRHTRLSEKWGCVLLLDEADVFLMSRGYNDMHRNAMVSIFLRQLEYYSGILFLTTNIVGVIDEAFKSRIHVALEYPPIDEESTLEIWRKMLQRIKRDNETAEMKILFNEANLMKFAKKHYRSHRHNGTTWNGRQIRNAFQTAIGIGQYERLKAANETVPPGDAPRKTARHIKLTVASFESVAETTNNFEKYITRTRGDDRERAAAHEFRRDEHSREPPRKSYRTHASSSSRSKLEMMRTDQRYRGGSSSPAPKRANKGKEVHRRIARTSPPMSGSEGQTDRDAVYRRGSDDGSDEEIIEEDIEDEDDEKD